MRSSNLSLALVALFAALLAVFGLVPKIDLAPGVPITLQTLGVMLAGCLLGWRGFFAVALFLVAVAFGMPFLSGGRGGLTWFWAIASGYLWAWPVGALVTGLVMERLPHATPGRAAFSAFVAAFLGGIVVVHASGVVWMALWGNLTLPQAFMITLVFIPGDLVKCLVCALVVHTVVRGVPGWRFGRNAAD